MADVDGIKRRLNEIEELLEGLSAADQKNVLEELQADIQAMLYGLEDGEDE
jgi:hypothetical protein